VLRPAAGAALADLPMAYMAYMAYMAADRGTAPLCASARPSGGGGGRVTIVFT
jgi:hypothetical protein